MGVLVTPNLSKVWILAARLGFSCDDEIDAVVGASSTSVLGSSAFCCGGLRGCTFARLPDVSGTALAGNGAVVAGGMGSELTTVPCGFGGPAGFLAAWNLTGKTPSNAPATSSASAPRTFAATGPKDLYRSKPSCRRRDHATDSNTCCGFVTCERLNHRLQTEQATFNL